jgi:hypothetical protein
LSIHFCWTEEEVEPVKAEEAAYFLGPEEAEEDLAKVEVVATVLVGMGDKPVFLGAAEVVVFFLGAPTVVH